MGSLMFTLASDGCLFFLMVFFKQKTLCNCNIFKFSTHSELVPRGRADVCVHAASQPCDYHRNIFLSAPRQAACERKQTEPTQTDGRYLRTVLNLSQFSAVPPVFWQFSSMHVLSQPLPQLPSCPPKTVFLLMPLFLER